MRVRACARLYVCVRASAHVSLFSGNLGGLQNPHLGVLWGARYFVSDTSLYKFIFEMPA